MWRPITLLCCTLNTWRTNETWGRFVGLLPRSNLNMDRTELAFWRRVWRLQVVEQGHLYGLQARPAQPARAHGAAQAGRLLQPQRGRLLPGQTMRLCLQGQEVRLLPSFLATWNTGQKLPSAGGASLLLFQSLSCDTLGEGLTIYLYIYTHILFATMKNLPLSGEWANVSLFLPPSFRKQQSGHWPQQRCSPVPRRVSIFKYTNASQKGNYLTNLALRWGH